MIAPALYYPWSFFFRTILPIQLQDFRQLTRFATIMGSIAVQPAIVVNSANRIEPGSIPLPIATLPDFSASICEDPDFTATAWVDSFNKALEKKDTASVLDHFHDESYWRDQLCLSWEFHTIHGTKKMATFFKQTNGVRIKHVYINRSSVVHRPTPTMIENLHCVNAFLVIETDLGHGGGIVQLVQDGGSWKAFTMFTFLKELIGHKETTGNNRLSGYENYKSGKSWLDSRKAELELEDGDPIVLVVGKRSVHILVTPLIVLEVPVKQA